MRVLLTVVSLGAGLHIEVIADQESHDQIVNAHFYEHEVHGSSSIQKKNRLPCFDGVRSGTVTDRNCHGIDRNFAAGTNRRLTAVFHEWRVIPESCGSFMELSLFGVGGELEYSVNSFLIVRVITQLISVDFSKGIIVCLHLLDPA